MFIDQCIQQRHIFLTSVNGNRFAITEKEQYESTDPKWWRNIKTGGFFIDQFLVIDKQSNKLNTSVYNRDFSKSNLCINGAYSLAKLVKNESEQIHIKMKNSLFKTNKDNEQFMTFSPKTWLTSIHPLTLDQTMTKGMFVDITNPHYLVAWPSRWDDTESQKRLADDINHIGYFKEGINISFYQPTKEAHRIKLKTFERGVGATKSCGSACLAYMLYQRTLNMKQNLIIEQPGGNTYLNMDTHDIVSFEGNHRIHDIINPALKQKSPQALLLNQDQIGI